MNSTISIVMSTYNGELYVQRQIESILNQIDVDVKLYIRDDGSSDSTVKKIEEIMENYPQKITLEKGENIGYQRSFIKALSNCPGADYYAFSDQDDIWNVDKCSRAIKKMQSLGEIALYASSLTLVDEEENEIGVNDITNMSNNIECYFARPRLAGCTFIFTPKLREVSLKVANMRYLTYPDHDFIVGACAYAYGSVYLDSVSSIQHRRLTTSVTGGKSGLIKRIKIEKNVVLNKNKICRDIADNILRYRRVDSNISTFLKSVSVYDKSFLQKIGLLRRKTFRSGILVCDIEMFIKVIIGRL